MIVEHLSIANNWDRPEVAKNPITLILGSFNPFNPNAINHTDYYYGRSSNELWKSIARNLKCNEDYFCNNFDRKIKAMNDYNFCFYDVVNELIINCDDEAFLNDFIEKNIYSNFFDSIVFKQSTRSKKITLTRNYNQNIINLLNKGKIKKVIHTMGNNTIDLNFKTICKENKLKEDGFQGFIEKIKTICEDNEIDFINQSYSPSQYAVRTKKTSMIELDNWVSKHILNL